jgi:hypothetical protein
MPTKTPSHDTQPRPPTAYAWHIDKPDGTGETVVANFCMMSNGALSFYNQLPLLNDSVLVRALSPQKWEDVQLVDTPHSAPVQFAPTR